MQDLFSIGKVNTALKTSIGGQYTTDVLPPSEKFFLGGTRFGRGFYYGQVTGDRAIGSSVELQFNTQFSDLPLVNSDYQVPLQFYSFWDYGHSYNVQNPAIPTARSSRWVGGSLGPRRGGSSSEPRGCVA